MKTKNIFNLEHPTGLGIQETEVGRLFNPGVQGQLVRTILHNEKEKEMPANNTLMSYQNSENLFN